MLEYFLNAYFCPVFIPTAEREKRQEKEDKRQSSKKGIRKQIIRTAECNFLAKNTHDL